MLESPSGHPKSQESTVQKIGIDEFGVWKAWKSKEAFGKQLYTGHKKYPKSEAKSLLLGSHCNKDPVVTVTKCCVKPAKAHAVPSEHLCTRWDGPWLAAQSRTQKHLWYVNDKRAGSMIRDIRRYTTISHGNSIFNQFPVRCGNISKHTGHDLAKNHSMLSSSSKEVPLRMDPTDKQRPVENPAVSWALEESGTALYSTQKDAWWHLFFEWIWKWLFSSQFL